VQRAHETSFVLHSQVPTSRPQQHSELELQRLIRTRIGPLGDERLEPGQWRYLEVDEVRGLYAAGASSDGVF